MRVNSVGRLPEDGLGGSQVAADENALQQLYNKEHEGVEKGLAEIDFVFSRIQLLQNCPQKEAAEELRRIQIL
jgi:hypothetical protein